VTEAERFVEELKAGNVHAFVVANKGADTHDLGPGDLVRRKQQVPVPSIPVWPSEQAAQQFINAVDKNHLIVVGLSYSELKDLLAKFATEPPLELMLSPRSEAQLS